MRGSKRYSVPKQDELWVLNQCDQSSERSKDPPKKLKCVKEKNRQWILLVPLIDVLLQVIAFITCYTISLKNGHVDLMPYVPFPNELNTKSIEQEIFTLCIVVSSCLTLLECFLRYKQISLLSFSIVNKLSFGFGLATVLGKVMVGIFPKDSTNNLSDAFGLIFLVSAAFYVVIQVYITKRTKVIASKTLLKVRSIIASLMVLWLIIFTLFRYSSSAWLNKAPRNIAQISIWIYITLFQCYTLSCYKDLKYVVINFKILTKATTHDIRAFKCMNNNSNKRIKASRSFDEYSLRSERIFSVRSWSLSQDELCYDDTCSLKTLV